MVIMITWPQFVLDPQSCEMTSAHLIGAYAVDRTVLRRGHQPGPGPGGHAAAGPRLDRAEDGVVESLLSEDAIVETIGQRREQPPANLHAKGAEDPGGRLPAGSRLGRAEAGVAETLLSEVEVLETIGQRREQPPAFFPADGAEDPGGRLWVGIHQ